MATPKPKSQNALSATTQNLLNSYNIRLQNDIEAMYENFNGVIEAAKVEESTQINSSTQYLFDNYQIKVRSANMVRAGNSLLKLISELKTFLILNDFPQVNKQVHEQNTILENSSKLVHSRMIALTDEVKQMANDLAAVYAVTTPKDS